MDVKFSVQGTGACPLCLHRSDCRIIRKTARQLSRNVKEKHDEVMELVIYRCPEFEEGK
ncbi:MAG: hypothetical protein PQJ61_13160 [Spirochaetales bacterium]|uniref:Uncharacterized protein n=1 Tax=Candidatus Thalassospirochaeta sargassi TaxID=3119039 RepID=A0AAJ1IKC4_9SPIO|nr:hypothetical protein [Spirochaetales bacterium]